MDKPIVKFTHILSLIFGHFMEIDSKHRKDENLIDQFHKAWQHFMIWNANFRRVGTPYILPSVSDIVFRHF